jgi:hypothetical protein
VDSWLAGAPAHHYIAHQVVSSTHGQEGDVSVKFLHDMAGWGQHGRTGSCATAYATAMHGAP